MTATFVIIAPPASEPVTAEEAMAFARVEHSAESALFDTLIKAAREHVEGICGLAIINQSWRALSRGLPALGLRLRPRWPTALTSVTVNGVAATPGFRLDPTSPGRLILARDGVPPAADAEIVAEYVAGYGPTASSAPQDLRLAILQIAAFWFENRSVVIDGENPASAFGDFLTRDLIARYRPARLA